MKIFVSVRNCVTNNATLPGIAEKGTMKLKLAVVTIAQHGI